MCLAFVPGSLAVSTASTLCVPQAGESGEKGAKRKATEENGSEELVEKKVCKGFQTV